MKKEVRLDYTGRRDEIWHLRSYFAAPDHDVNIVEFAEAMLRVTKQHVARDVSDYGFAARRALDILKVELADPDAPAGPPVVAYVSGGVWIGKCECGGASMVDFERPIFMCCTCWNAATGGAWRPLVLPNPKTRATVDAVLIVREETRRRTWYASEKIAQLVKENVDHGIRAVLDVAELAAATAVEEGKLEASDV